MICKNQVQNPAQDASCIPIAQMNFIFRARMIWRDLATWMRAYMVSLYGGVGNTEAISQRLYELPAEYGNLLRVFFGDQTTEQYMALLTQYIALFQSLIVAQINNDVNSVNNLTQQIYQNINERADFLARVNPYWLKSEWLTLSNSFASMQIEEATTFLTKEYTRNIDVYERLLSLTNIIGDYFLEGLVNYFMFRQQQQAT